LGFVCEAYGIPKEKMSGRGMPLQLPYVLQDKLPKWLLAHAVGSDLKKAAQINDDQRLTWKEKEKLLRPLFRKHRIQLVFRGKR
jgi:hypothetical protein